MNFVKQHFFHLIIVLLFVIIILQRCDKPTIVEKPIIIRDTVWVHVKDTVYTKPKIVYTKPDTVIDTTYLPNPDYGKLKEQYRDLLTKYFNTNVTKDTLKIDSIGHVYVTDWVWKNQIESRKYTYDIKFPVIKETITPPVKTRNQLYIGGSLQGNFTNPINQINAGLLLKNKKDQIFGLYTGMNMEGQLQYGIQSYWKISFRK